MLRAVLVLLALRLSHGFVRTSPYSITASAGQPCRPPPLEALNSRRGCEVMTLSRFMIEATRSDPDHSDIESLMQSIQIACKTISNLVARAGVSDLTGEQIYRPAGSSDEDGVTLDKMADRVLRNALRFTGKLGVLGSEDEKAILVEEAWNSKYVACFDPLDGLANLEVGIPTGTIFGIFKESDECLVDFGERVSKPAEELLLKALSPADNMIAAGYCIYSSSTVLVFCLGRGLGVHGFTLDPLIGEFVMTHPNIRIPKRGRTYALNEANSEVWPSGLQQYIQNIKSGRGESHTNFNCRYVGSMVGDVHRTLLRGGIFGYPPNAKYREGKLHLVYEAAPMAFLVEQAGGKASTGRHRILDLIPSSLYQRIPVYLGSEDDVTELEGYLTTKAYARPQ